MIDFHRQKSAVFFITTGRTGTQWFAVRLSEYYGDLARVSHEPFQEAYQPRLFFDAYHREDHPGYSSSIAEHIAAIKETIDRKTYIETGWPVYGILPFLLREFEHRVKVVHLFRHPLRVAASLTTHDFYSRGDWTEAVCLHPTDAGVEQEDLAGLRWEEMQEFEKCLFWTTEINLYAGRLRSQFPEVPWLELKFEDLFFKNDSRELRSVLDFLDFPKREGVFESLEARQDKHTLKTDQEIDLAQVTKYPLALEVMHQLGYDSTQQTSEEISKRYQYNLIERLVRKLGRRLVRILAKVFRTFFPSE